MRRMCCLAYLALTASAAWGDGCFVEPVISDRISGATGVASTEQKGVIIELPEGREALLLQTTYHGPADRFAWIIPVPGKPGRDDVFLASPTFIDELMENTRPEVETEITDPEAKRGGGWGLEEGEEEGLEEALAADEPSVTVHERMAVGDFDVAVLSATGPDVLTDWLTENRYRIPEGSSDIFGHYVEKRWYFVAVRMQPGKVEERPVLQDVDPIGIRFDAEELVYPLYISRASSREKTAMLLMVLSSGPVACDQLAEAELPLGEWLPKGTCYATLRREAVEAKSGSAVCEFRGPEGMAYVDLHYEKDRSTGPEGSEWSAGDLWTTRLWTILDREEMEDLTLTQSDDQETARLAVLRKGEVFGRGSEWVSSGLATIRDRVRRQSRAGGMTWLYAAAGAALFVCTLWSAGRGPVLRPRYVWWALIATLLLAALCTASSPVAARAWTGLGCLLALTMMASGRAARSGPSAKLSPGDLLKGAVIAAGLGAFGHIAYCLFGGGEGFLRRNADGVQVLSYWRGAAPLPCLLLAVVAQLVWVGLAVGLVRRGLRGTGVKARWLALPLLCLGIIVAGELAWGYLTDELREGLAGHRAPIVGLLVGISTLTLGALCVLVAFVIAGWRMGENARRTSAPMARALVGLLLVGVIASVVGMTSAHAGMGGYLSSGLVELDAALAELDNALVQFRARYGCLPTRLTDLGARMPPEVGVDSSGNPVATTPQPGGGASTLAEVPVDPLTGRSDTWLYEPTGSPMIDSGGYRIRLEARPVAPPEVTKIPDAWGERGHEDPSRHPRAYWDMGRPAGELLDVQSPSGLLRPESIADEHGPRRVLGLDYRGFVLVCGNAGTRLADWARVNPSIEAISDSADGRRVVYADNGVHNARLYAGEVGGRMRRVLREPWPVEVYDLAWHPSADQWLVVARDLDRGAEASVYVVNGEGSWRRVTGPDNVVAARFAPDGKSILAIITPTQWRARYGTRSDPHLSESQRLEWRLHLLGPRGSMGEPDYGALWSIGLDGRNRRKLADRVALAPFVASPDGCVALSQDGDTDTHLVHVDRAGRPRLAPLPLPRAMATDAWVGDGEVLVALRQRMQGTLRGYQSDGELWRYVGADGTWRLIGRWRAQVSGAIGRNEGGLRIIGRDAAARAYVIAYGERPPFETYAVRDRDLGSGVPVLAPEGAPSYYVPLESS